MKLRSTVARPMPLTVTLAMILGAAASTAGCGPDVPANPDWATDVRPILQARCVRCHNSAMPQLTDPAVVDKGPQLDFSAGSPLAMSLFNSMIVARIRGMGGVRMPPPPNAPLEDWQIEILVNYSKTHP